MVKTGRRGGVLIEPYKQLRFGLMFLLLNLVFAALIFGVLGYFLWDVYSALQVYFKLDEAQSALALAKFSKPLLFTAALLVLFILSTLFLSARYTFQIYGPLVSVKRFLDEILAGQVPQPINLRESDQLHDLVFRLNGVSKLLLQADPSSHQEILLCLDELLAGRKPKLLELKKEDPLYELSKKVNTLVEK